MSEVMEKEEQLTTAPETEVQPVQEAKPSLGQKWKNLPKKKRRRIVRWLVVLVILVALAGILWKVFGSKSGGGKAEVMTAEVQYGSITSTVEGSGMTRAKNSEAITVTTAGTMSEVFVTEGQQVKAGDPLFTVDSPAARAAVDKARADVTGVTKQLACKRTSQG